MSRPAHVLPSPMPSAPLPEVVNHTPWPSQYFQHVDSHGEIFHVMVSRLTYSLRGMRYEGEELPSPVLLDMGEQSPLCDADQFIGEANETSALQESDYAPYKPKCDVLLVNANAYSPDSTPQKRWPVGFRFGDLIEKKFQVTGPRTFERSVSSLGAMVVSEPQAVVQVPLRYELAFGGPNAVRHRSTLESIEADQTLPDSTRRDAGKALEKLPPHYEHNPIGCGREPKRAHSIALDAMKIEGAARGSKPSNAELKAIEQSPLFAPQIEAFEQPFKGQNEYPVIGVGPIGRWWLPRRKLAGTYDEKWKAEQWPKSPKDHDYRYWNCAPEDQQIDYPQGGEEIALINLTPSGSPVRFLLPKQDLQLLIRLHVGAMMFAPMNIDTVLIDFATGQLVIVRRALVSARTGVRQLELGTWPPGTAMELSEELKTEHAARQTQRMAGG